MLCFFDYDGTLADDFNTINKDNIEYIQRHSANFLLATGRNLNQINDILNKNNLKIDFIGGNGSFYSLNGKINILDIIEPKIVNILIQKLVFLSVPIIIHTITDNYTLYYGNVLKLFNIKKIANEFSRFTAGNQVTDISLIKLYIKTFFNKNSHIIYKNQISHLKNITSIEVFFNNPDTHQQISDIFNKFGNCTESYYTSVEFNGDASKGNAVSKILSKKNYPFSYSLGNEFNDISMFQVTNVAYKMAHSPIELPAIELPYGPQDAYLPQIFP